MNRLRLFSTIEWTIPDDIDSNFNELKCAAKGWSVWPESLSTYANHIVCQACGAQLILQFEPNDTDHAFACLLVRNYARQIQASHDSDCIWKDIETPLNGGYYLRMHIQDVEHKMASDYLERLQSFVATQYQKLQWDKYTFPSFDFESFGGTFADASQEWLIRRYWRHDKENLLAKRLPPALLGLAAWGWLLRFISVEQSLAIKLQCDLCFQSVAQISQPDANDEPPIDPELDHKQWCRYRHFMVSASGDPQLPFSYLTQIVPQLIRSVNNVGDLISNT